jgi:hypothetical protein
MRSRGLARDVDTVECLNLTMIKTAAGFPEHWVGNYYFPPRIVDWGLARSNFILCLDAGRREQTLREDVFLSFSLTSAYVNQVMEPRLGASYQETGADEQGA